MSRKRQCKLFISSWRIIMTEWKDLKFAYAEYNSGFWYFGCWGNFPEYGWERDFKEEEMASHEDRKQKNARFWQMWLVGGLAKLKIGKFWQNFRQNESLCCWVPTTPHQPVVNFCTVRQLDKSLWGHHCNEFWIFLEILVIHRFERF